MVKLKCHLMGLNGVFMTFVSILTPPKIQFCILGGVHMVHMVSEHS